MTEIASKQPATSMAGQSVAVRSAGQADVEGRSVGRLFTFFLIALSPVLAIATLIVVFGLQPGLLLNLVQGSVDDVLESVTGRQAIPIPTEVVLMALALILIVIVGRTVAVALGNRREDAVVAVEGGGA